LIFRVSKSIPARGLISKAVTFYLLLVAAHLLGRFCWHNKDKLDWGI